MRKRRTVQVHSRAMPELLGEPALEFKSLQGQERLSTLYSYHLELQPPRVRHEPP